MTNQLTPYQTNKLKNTLNSMNLELYDLEPSLKNKSVFVLNSNSKMPLLYNKLDTDIKYSESIKQIEEKYSKKLEDLPHLPNPSKKEISEVVASIFSEKTDKKTLPFPSSAEFSNLINSFFQIEYNNHIKNKPNIILTNKASEAHCLGFLRNINASQYSLVEQLESIHTDHLKKKINPNSNVLLYENSIGNGNEEGLIVDTIRSRGGTIEDIFAIVNKSRNARDLLNKKGVNLHDLTTLDRIKYMLFQ